MELLLPNRFERAATAYGYQRVIFEQVAAEAALRYGAIHVPLDGPTLALARGSGGPHLVGA